MFELRGFKLHGRCTLVKNKQNWLLIKELDGYVNRANGADYPADSGILGLPCEQPSAGKIRAPGIRQRPAGEIEVDDGESGAKRTATMASAVC